MENEERIKLSALGCLIVLILSYLLNVIWVNYITLPIWIFWLFVPNKYFYIKSKIHGLHD